MISVMCTYQLYSGCCTFVGLGGGGCRVGALRVPNVNILEKSYEKVRVWALFLCRHILEVCGLAWILRRVNANYSSKLHGVAHRFQYADSSARKQKYSRPNIYFSLMAFSRKACSLTRRQESKSSPDKLGWRTHLGWHGFSKHPYLFNSDMF